MIPPSIAMVVYGWLSGTSIAALFVAGVVPGVMIGIALMITCFVVSYWIEMPRSATPAVDATGAAVLARPAAAASPR